MSGQVALAFDWVVSLGMLIWLMLAALAQAPSEEREGPYREPTA